MNDSPTNASMSKEELSGYFASIADRYDDLGTVDLAGIQLRPGGTVSGPAQFTIIDSVGWMMTVAQVGPGWDAFTAEVTMQFLRPLLPSTVSVDVEVLRKGGRIVMQMAIDPSPQGPATHAVASFVARPT
jgi:acyl-coenzyme A thioesterase PaaI-like protein